MEPHWLEHALLAIPIGVGAILIFGLVARYNKPFNSYAAAGWIGGVFYYLGREIRDYEKGTVGDIGFDYSGLFAPIISCLLVFGGGAALFASQYKLSTTYTFVEWD
jgi:hypothetical protein